MQNRKSYLVTGGAGFIGSAVVRRLIEATDNAVLVVDKLTYAGNLDSLRGVSGSNRYAFEQSDIVDAAANLEEAPVPSPDELRQERQACGPKLRECAPFASKPNSWIWPTTASSSRETLRR